jgi:hypothetical protein
MRATRRRHRTVDLLASPAAVRGLCQQLREHLPDLIPKSESELIRFLYAVRHVERHWATDTKRGRPSRWPREHLLKVASVLRSVLERETSGRVSLSSFIGQFIPILSFPSDATDALESGDINLQEATHLARLTPERLDCTPAQARSTRREVLQAHLRMRGSQNSLRACVKEILGETVKVSSEGMTQAVAKVDELLEIDPADQRHFFYEEMKRLFYAMREVEPEDLDDEVIERFMAVADEMSNVLHSIDLKRRRREAKTVRFAL